MAELQIGDSVQTGLKFQYKYIYKVTQETWESLESEISEPSISNYKY